jgi:hypothetical protein
VHENIRAVMSNRKLVVVRSASWVGVSILVVLLCIGPANAQGSPANYTFLLASGFLCDPGGSGVCPATAKSQNGDGYQLSGAGTFSTQGKSVIAAGTFNHESSNGAVLESGVWLATELVGFDSYGIEPAAGRAFGQGSMFDPSRFRPRRLPILSGFLPTGGLAVLRIRLLPVSGPNKNGGAAGELRIGESASRTFCGRDSTHKGKEWRGIVCRGERARDVPLDAFRGQRPTNALERDSIRESTIEVPSH